MTDNTSPVARLAASLPKGNGLTRAAGDLYSRKGSLVPFIGYVRVEEVAEDLNDVRKVLMTIQRLELCTGELERDAKSLVARASFQANNHPGQMTLMAEPGTAAAAAEDRDRYIRFLREWQKEQDPQVSDADAAQLWHGFSGGHYGPLDQAAPAYIREFLLERGVLPEEGTKSKDEASLAIEPDDAAAAEPAAAAAPKKAAKAKKALAAVPSQPPAGKS